MPVMDLHARIIEAPGTGAGRAPGGGAPPTSTGN